MRYLASNHHAYTNMTTLPKCRWRTMHADGSAACSSVKIGNGDKPFDPAHICVNHSGATCFAADHEPLTPEQLAERASLRKPAPAEGPGMELKVMLADLGIEPGQCNCNVRAAQMNAWGIEGCREHRLEIAAWLKEAAVSVVTEFKVDDPVEAFLPLVDEAIRRAVSKRVQTPSASLPT